MLNDMVLRSYCSGDTMIFVSLPQRGRWLAYICETNSETDEESIFLLIICRNMML